MSTKEENTDSARGMSSDEKNLKNRTKNGLLRAPLQQTEFAFMVEVEKDVNGITMGVLENGIPYLTETGLAALCGIHRKTLYTIAEEWSKNENNERNQKIHSLLEKVGYSGKELYLEIYRKNSKYKAYPEAVCMALLEYFAFEDSSPRPDAQQNFRILARVSFRQYIYTQVGYAPQTKLLNDWKYFLDRVDLNYENVPNGYFSIFREISGLTVSLIRAGLIVNDKTIPDISVGISWGKYWEKNNLTERYGDRIKYTHNYPNYYPQSFSNPQQPWAYPDEALAEFRAWFKNEYLSQKFPKYLLAKVEQKALPVGTDTQIVQALLPN